MSKLMKNFSRSQKRLSQGTENQGVRSPFFRQDNRALDDKYLHRRSNKNITFTSFLFKQSNHSSKKKQEKPIAVHET